MLEEAIYRQRCIELCMSQGWIPTLKGLLNSSDSEWAGLEEYATWKSIYTQWLEQADTKKENKTMANLGKVAYEGYYNNCHGKSLVSGAALPLWEGQSLEIQNAWQAAAEAVVSSIMSQPSKVE